MLEELASVKKQQFFFVGFAYRNSTIILNSDSVSCRITWVGKQTAMTPVSIYEQVATQASNKRGVSIFN